MSNPLNSTIHPEIGPRNLTGMVDRPTGVTGAIVFNQPPALTQKPQEVIAGAIARGDTIAGRVQQMQEALSPTPEQN